MSHAKRLLSMIGSLKKLRIVACMIFLAGSMAMQGGFAQDIVWQEVIGGSGHDKGQIMIPVENGCYILGGVTASADGPAKGNHKPGTYDIIVMKVSAKGQVIWSTVIGGSGEEVLSDMKRTPDGGVVLIGTTESKDGDIQAPHKKMEMLVAKLNRLGKKEWVNCFGGSGNDKGMAVEPLSDGRYLIGGESGSMNGDISFSYGGLDMWVAFLNKDGELLKEKSLGGREAERVTHIMEAGKNKYLVVGTTTSKGGDVKLSYGKKDVWILMLSKNFDIIWQNTYGGSDYDEVQGLMRNSKGEFVLSGTTFSEDKDMDLTRYNGFGDSWAFLITEWGNLAWSHCYGGTRSEGGSAIAECPDGGYIMVGMTNTKALQHPITPVIKERYYDGWVVRMDSIGRLRWRGSFGGENFDQLLDVQALDNENYLTLGFTESVKDDLQKVKEDVSNDFWMVHFTDPSGTAIERKSKPHLSGYTKDAITDIALKTEIVITNNEDLSVVKKQHSNGRDGTYEIEMVKTGKYSINFMAPGYMWYGQDLEEFEVGDIPEVRLDVKMQPLVEGAKVILKHTYYEIGKWDLREESIPELRRLKAFLQMNPNVKIEISGHTDNSGNRAQKEELSLRRAKSVRDFLLKEGINGTQMQVAGYGLKRPIAPNETPEGRAKNRRVEVEVILIM